jgi:hypothetical protein
LGSDQVEVVISAAGDEAVSYIASLRAWLDSASAGPLWTLDTEPPPGGDALGPDIGTICAIIGAAEGLPPLIAWIKSWFTTKQDPPPVTLTITIDPAKGDVAIKLGGRQEVSNGYEPNA